jgi:DNA gyrase/topoisomerase IV subunit B
MLAENWWWIIQGIGVCTVGVSAVNALSECVKLPFRQIKFTFNVRKRHTGTSKSNRYLQGDYDGTSTSFRFDREIFKDDATFGRNLVQVSEMAFVTRVIFN